MPSYKMLNPIVLVITYVSEEYSMSIIRVTRLEELGTASVLIRATRRHIPEDYIFSPLSLHI
jgi:hypothetical protein